MRNIFYHNFTHPTTGLPSLRGRDGQRLVVVGDPQFRKGKYWSNSGSQGLEFGKATINTIDNTGIPAWHAQAGLSHNNVTVELSNDIQSPFPGIPVTKIVVTNASDPWMLYGSDVDVFPQGWYTHTIYYFKPLDQNPVLSGYFRNMEFISGWLDYGVGVEYDVQGVWTRAQFSRSVPGGVTSCYMRLQMPAEVGATLYVCAAQLEEDDFNQDYASPFDSANLEYGVDRVDQYAKIPLAGNFPGMDGGTIILSIRPDYNYDTLNSLYLFHVWDGSSYNDAIGIEYLDGSDKFRFLFQAGGSSSQLWSQVQTFSRGDKILLIASWDGTDIRFWVNGIIGEDNSLPQYSFSPGGNDMILGNLHDLTNLIFSSTVFDEVAIFDESFNQRLADKVYANFLKNKTLVEMTI